GRVDRSLPNAAVSLVKRSPVSCMPSPESPAKRIVTRSSTWNGLVIVDSLDSKRTGHLHPVAASSRPPGAQRPTTPRVGGRQPALPAYTDPFGKLFQSGGIPALTAARRDSLRLARSG